jgi:hypothetical protein
VLQLQSDLVQALGDGRWQVFCGQELDRVRKSLDGRSQCAQLDHQRLPIDAVFEVKRLHRFDMTWMPYTHDHLPGTADQSEHAPNIKDAPSRQVRRGLNGPHHDDSEGAAGLRPSR